jgi:predicted nucleic acid-binding Zn ribbon protein
MALYRRTPKGISSALSEFFDSLPNRKQFKRSLAVNNWPNIVGERIHSQTKNISIEGSKLVVKMSSSLWRHEVHAQRFSILNKLNDSVNDEVFTELFIKE